MAKMPRTMGCDAVVMDAAVAKAVADAQAAWGADGDGRDLAEIADGNAADGVKERGHCRVGEPKDV